MFGMFFETDKAFLLPSAIPGIRVLRRFYEDHRGRGLQVLVVGHTDTAGSDQYNLALSNERAESIGAYLRDRFEVWTAWFGSDRQQSKRWGTREVQHMLSALSDGSTRFYGGAITGANDAATRDAVKRFQQWSNDTRGTALAVDGDAGPATRPEIIKVYMAQDGTSLPADVPLLTHGCGEFHRAIETGDGVSDERNRRVEVFFFEGPVTPAPQTCTAPGCKEYPLWDAAVIEEIDLKDRPDEDVLRGRITYLDGRPAAFVPFIVDISGGARKGGFTDSQGRYEVEGVKGAAQFRLVDRLSLAGTPDEDGNVVVAVNDKGGGGDPGGGGGDVVVV
jgi:outer membrane protein OmpA-like peptidoglycan-associated protein